MIREEKETKQEKEKEEHQLGVRNRDRNFQKSPDTYYTIYLSI